MMMTAFPVHVTVRFFFIGGVAYRDDFDGEEKILACQRMVAIHGDGGFIDGGDGDGHATLRRLSLELHAWLDVIDTLEGLARDLLHHEVMMFAIAFGGSNFDIEFIAGLFADQGVFQAGDDLADAMQIGQRRMACRAVNNLAVFISEGVMEADHAVFADLHNSGFLEMIEKKPRRVGVFSKTRTSFITQD